MGIGNSGCIDEWPKPKKSRREENQEIGWECMPAVILDNVFQYLSFKDIVNASSTCRNWRQNLYHPRLWQQVTFKIDPEHMHMNRYLRTTVGYIVSDVTVKYNSMLSSCVAEFLTLLEYLVNNNNLQSLVLEPSHSHMLLPDSLMKSLKTIPVHETILKLCTRRPITKLTLGCNEELLDHVPKVLKALADYKPEKVTTLGLASVKDDPVYYIIHNCDPKLFLPFRSLKILSIDYDGFNDSMLEVLQKVDDLHRIVIHIHGISEEHPGTSEEAWRMFRKQQPNCLLRLSLIHAFDEVDLLHRILKQNMPLSHLKVLFCESMNPAALEKLIEYHETFVSLMWIDSVNNQGVESYSLLSGSDLAAPQNLILISWLCKKLEELVVFGYKYYEDDWIGVAKLRSNTLKKLQVAKSDVLNGTSNLSTQMPKILGNAWSLLNYYDLHPVLLDPSDADSDEYLMPILLEDLK